MFSLTQIPTLVEHYAPYFEHLFQPGAYDNFQRYLSGLMVSENKTVEGINRLFTLNLKNQSTLNRFLTQSKFDEQALNRQRLSLLQSQATTRLKSEGKVRGVLSVDDTILPHYGRHFEGIAKLYDPTDERYVYGHNLVTLHYSDDGVDYPVFYLLWQPVDVAKLEQALRQADVRLNPQKELLKTTDAAKWRKYLLFRWRNYQYRKPQLQQAYKTKLIIARELLTDFVRSYPHLDLPIAMDNWYTKVHLCKYIDQELERAYVGKLTPSDKLISQEGSEQTLEDFAAQLQHQHKERLGNHSRPVFEKTTIHYKGQKETRYTYCRTHYINGFGRQRLTISYRKEDLKDDPLFLISNRLGWRANGMLRIYRHRWPVEVYHEEGKAEGLDQYQVRDFLAVNKHIAMVVLLYSLLQLARFDSALLSKLQMPIEKQIDGSLAHWRRLAKAEALLTFAQWLSVALLQGQSVEKVLEPFLKAIAY